MNRNHKKSQIILSIRQTECLVTMATIHQYRVFLERFLNTSF